MGWSSEFPKEAGCYWFYGVRNVRITTSQPKLLMTEACSTSNGISVVCDGDWMYPGQTKGKWKKMDTPDIPEDWNQ